MPDATLMSCGDCAETSSEMVTSISVSLRPESDLSSFGRTPDYLMTFRATTHAVLRDTVAVLTLLLLDVPFMLYAADVCRKSQARSIDDMTVARI